MTRDMTLKSLRNAYLNEMLTPHELMEEIRQQCSTFSHHNIWIHLLTEEDQNTWLEALSEKPIANHPLWGIPFAIKDNIDLAGIPTTAACPDSAYVPEKSASVVQRLIDAGAIPVGKTNLDQFATGLNGTRSPHGPCRNAFDPEYISGGSSAGSAAAVALGLSSFSLGTDTAGSGRVPAGFNNLIGVKPTIGLLSSTGMLPACRSLDCMSIFAFTCDDAAAVLTIAEGFDNSDAYSRKNPFSNSHAFYGKRIGKLVIAILPDDQIKFFGSSEYEDAYRKAINDLQSYANIELIEIDYSPFDEAAQLLYSGPWVTERYLACKDIIDHRPDIIHPVVREIIEGGRELKASGLFEAQYRLQALKKTALESLIGTDCLMTPTAGRHYRIDEMLEDPIALNTRLGYYTNFMNLFDMSAVSVPVGLTKSKKPFGVTLSNKNFYDRSLLSIANLFEEIFPTPLGASTLKKPKSLAIKKKNHATVEVVVCGAHLEDLPLNWQLTQRGANLVKRAQTAPKYQLFALRGDPPARPGMVRNDENGTSIAVEVWQIPTNELGSFLMEIPAPLGLGKVELDDGDWYTGFICETSGLTGAEDITRFGGWKNWLRYSEQLS